MKNIKIDTNILSQTTQCRDNFSCLSGKNDCLCGVEDDMENGSRMIFVKPQEKKLCNYKMSYGNSCLCNCPTRITLYIEYNI